MSKIGALTLLISLFTSAVLASGAAKVTTFAAIYAPFCCGAADVMAYLEVTVENVTDTRYSSSDIYWQIKSDVSNCDVFSTPWQDRTFCCVGTGNKGIIRQYWQPALCPIEARSRSFALIGGNELPDCGDDDISGCIKPCLGPEDCDGGGFP